MAIIKLWLSPDLSKLQADITLQHSSTPVTNHQANLALSIKCLPEGYPREEYLPATQWLDGKPYYSSQDSDTANWLEPGPLLIMVSLMINLRGWVRSGNICVKDLSVNDHAAKRLRPEPGRWLLGADRKRLFIVENVTIRPDMRELIDPS